MAVEKVASATFLHNLRPTVASELAKSIAAIDNRHFCDLGVAENKVAVCLVGLFSSCFVRASVPSRDLYACKWFAVRTGTSLMAAQVPVDRCLR